MRWEVADEVEELKKKLKNNEMHKDKSNSFIEQLEYEDDYSHNEINEIQTEFKDIAEAYLKENYKGEYAIKHGIYSVLIVTIELLIAKELTMGWTRC